MRDRLTSWFINTCLLGLIPVISRFFVWSISDGQVEMLAAGDLVAFGLVVHSACINDLSRSKVKDAPLKTVVTGMSVLFLVIYALILCTTIAPNAHIKANAALNATVYLCFVSFIIGMISIFGFREQQVSEQE